MLIRQGAFTSTPVNPPKWAFDLQYLAFVREQFLAGIPNYSAWCNGAVAFLTKEGLSQVPSAVSNGKDQTNIGITNQFSSQPLLALYHPVYSIISLSWTASTPLLSRLFGAVAQKGVPPLSTERKEREKPCGLQGRKPPPHHHIPFPLHLAPPLFVHQRRLTLGSKKDA